MAARYRSDPVPSPGEESAAEEICLAGAHGGAGVTTLAIWLQPAQDLGAIRYAGHGCAPLRTGGWPLVLVTRNTVPTSAKATAAVSAITAQGLFVAVLAVVSDGLPEPPEATYRFRILGPRVGGIVRVPFAASLRAAGDPAQAGLPRKAHRALAEIRAQANARACGPQAVTAP
jgi:hypothetical protein